MEAMLRFGFARRFNDDLLDLWVHAFLFPPSFIPSLFSFVSFGFNHYGGSPNNIRLYQEERVARNFGLTGFSLQLTPFLSGTEVMILESGERRERGLWSKLGKVMVGLINRLLGVLEVPLEAFC